MSLSLIVPVLRVSDVMESINWYYETLGFEADPFPELPPFKFAILRKGRNEIMLRASSGEIDRQSKPYQWDLYLRLENEPFRELFTRLNQSGIVTRRLERMFYGMSEFELTDPDGHVICLGQYLDDADDLPTPEV